MAVVPRRPREGNSLADTNPALASEWHESNPFGPDAVSPGSHYIAKWVCAKDPRHVYPSRVLHRSHGRGCGICHGTIVVAGVNDITTTHPELAAQWSPNNPVSVLSVNFGSNTDFLWVCANGHEYRMSPNKKTALEQGCSVCAGKRVAQGINDLFTTHPQLAAEVHPSSKWTAHEVTAGSGKKLSWQCSLSPAHVWEAAVVGRVHGNGCPVCAGYAVIVGVNDLTTTHPHLHAHWHPTSPPMTQFHEGSHTRLKWKCPEGHETVTLVRNRARKDQGCSVCTGSRIVSGVNDLATRNPLLAAEWHPGNPHRADEVALNSNYAVKWRCSRNPTHVWEVSPNARARNGCPHCVRNTFTSKGEKELAAWVEAAAPHLDVQRNTRSVVKGHELDIFVPGLSLAVEFNGNYYHSDRFRAPSYHRDKFKDCERAGVSLVQITESQWAHRKDSVKNFLTPLLTREVVPQACMSASTITRAEAEVFHTKHSMVDVGTESTNVGVIVGDEVVAAVTLNITDDVAVIVGFTATLYNRGDALVVTSQYVSEKYSQVQRWIVASQSMVSDGSEFLDAGFTFVANKPLSYKLFRHRELNSPEDFPKSRFRSDPSLKFSSGHTLKQLCDLNNIPRVYDAGGKMFAK